MTPSDHPEAATNGVRHVVMFRWRPGVTSDEIEALRSALAGLPAAVDSIASYEFGTDLGINEGNADFVVVAGFASEADYLTYRDHPDHRRVITEIILPLITERVAVQFRV